MAILVLDDLTPSPAPAAKLSTKDARQKARAQIDNIFKGILRAISNGYTSCNTIVYNNPDGITVQDVMDEYAEDGKELLRLIDGLKGTANNMLPNAVPDAAPDAVLTVNSDNTVRVG